ncbi:hypothetical protein [Bordetella holmesii]|uniref:N-acetyltransferase YedL n=2 Tax=Bordetella holmesii TaxID=35814 RepID=A0A158M9B7_9BORD|nr:hypothetical protein [Bordetella holmesii]AHV93831.1 hypothetical protein D560_1640 [Bordetella holmesii ATCC 51541]AIT26300.1 hypothetical protein D558_1628 [Bordetella holmesii 44057]EWM41768.1 hypothetical protein D556_1641 [Bordetella holmesii 41130]EWM46873.1 hypothetical protein D555_1654 [Bordetella holmesii 35009]EWM51045.1 hypothetical protein D557_0896 [Bordetella holmesii 70147]
MNTYIGVCTRTLWLAGLGLSMAAGQAFAADAFPSRPVRIIVGSEAGSAPD